MTIIALELIEKTIRFSKKTITIKREILYLDQITLENELLIDICVWVFPISQQISTFQYLRSIRIFNSSPVSYNNIYVIIMYFDFKATNLKILLVKAVITPHYNHKI